MFCKAKTRGGVAFLPWTMCGIEKVALVGEGEPRGVVVMINVGARYELGPT